MVTFYSCSYRNRVGNIHEEYTSVDSWTKAEFMSSWNKGQGKWEKIRAK